MLGCIPRKNRSSSLCKPVCKLKTGYTVIRVFFSLLYFRFAQVDENILTRIFRTIETLYGYMWSVIASERKYCYAKFSNTKYLRTKITQIMVFISYRDGCLFLEVDT